MKFCAVICEYNPFHNGHKYLLEQARERSGCDRILCLMSGNFTQRGEPAVFDKYTRARHAVENGADVVAELPAAFATAPAELFAEGAVHLLTSLPNVSALAFGCESGDRESFLSTAAATLNETKEFRAALKEGMRDGTSYIRARNAALLALSSDVDEALLTAPNNILGIEYCRALLAANSKAEPIPVPRVGSGYADTDLHSDFSSATALRGALRDDSRPAKKALKRNLPRTVWEDAEHALFPPYEEAAMCALACNAASGIAATPDCSEGLENRMKALMKSNPRYRDMLEKCVSKRYTLSRLKRVLLQNLLGIAAKDVRAWLQSPLYIKTLAVRREGAEEILSALREGSYPVLVRKSDALLLKKDALACFALDARACDVYAALTGAVQNEYQTVFVD